MKKSGFKKSFRTLLNILSFLGLISFLSNSVLASSGITAAEFLKINPDPATVAMGEGSFGIYSDQPSAVINNPAGLVGVDRAKLFLSHTSYVEGLSYNYSSFALPLAYGHAGFSIGYLGYGEIEGRKADFTRYSLSSSYDLAAVFSYAMPIRKTIPVVKEFGSIGLNLKFIRSKLADYSAEAIALDFGGIYEVPFVENMTLGFAYKNVGTGIKYIKETNELPQTLGFGLGYAKPNYRDLKIIMDVNMPNKGAQSISLGASFSPVYFLAVRAGYKQTQDAFNSGVRAGVGLKLESFQIDYSFSPVEYFTPVHNISVSLPVGNIFSPTQATDYYIQKHFRLGLDYFRSGDYVLAKQKFQAIVDTYPEHEPSKKYLLKVEEAIQQLKKKQKNQIGKYVKKGNIAFEKKDYITAKKYFAYALQIENDNLTARSGMKNVEDALYAIQSEIRREKNSKVIAENWGLAMDLYKKGEYLTAREKLAEILKVDPEHKEAEKYTLEINNKLQQIASTEVSKIYNQATDLYNRGNYSEARRYFEAVTLAAPERLDAKDFMQRCDEKIKEINDKERASRIASEQGKYRSTLDESYGKAVKFYEKNKHERALFYFLESKKIAEEYEFADELGRIKNYIAMTKMSLGEQYYKEGFSNYQKNKFDEAAKLYKEALKYDPDNASAKVELNRISKSLAQINYERGMTYFSQGDMEKAKDSFQKALSYDPQMKESQRALERIK